MEKTKQKKKIPPLCLALDLFCAGMSLIMLVLTVVGHIRDFSPADNAEKE